MKLKHNRHPVFVNLSSTSKNLKYMTFSIFLQKNTSDKENKQIVRKEICLIILSIIVFRGIPHADEMWNGAIKPKQK